jgi:hypothetical protein
MMTSFAKINPAGLSSHPKSLVSALRALRKLSKEVETEQYHINE